MGRTGFLSKVRALGRPISISEKLLLNRFSGFPFKSFHFYQVLLAVFILMVPQLLEAEDLSSQLKENEAIQTAAGDPASEPLQINNSSSGKERDLYFSVSGMAVFPHNTPLDGTDKNGRGPAANNAIPLLAEINAGNLGLVGRPGAGATAALGKKLRERLRGEIEFAYRTGTFKELLIRDANSPNVTGANNGVDIVFKDSRYTARSLLFNLLYDVPLTERLSPYIGAGFGMGWTTVDEGLAKSGGHGLAYQVMTGLSYRATERVELFTGYRFYDAQYTTRVFDQVLVEVDTHSAEAGLRYYLDPVHKSSDGSIFAFRDNTQKNPFYIKASGSVIQQQDMGTRIQNITFNQAINTVNREWEKGYGVGLAVGYRVCSMCRVELEYSFKRSELQRHTDRAPA